MYTVKAKHSVFTHVVKNNLSETEKDKLVDELRRFNYSNIQIIQETLVRSYS